MTTDSLVEQFKGVKNENKEYIFGSAVIIFNHIQENNISNITVLDKHEQPKTIEVTGHTGIRIRQKNGKRTTFYLNTLLMNDSIITGYKTHFLNARIKPININNIAKIELQE